MQSMESLLGNQDQEPIEAVDDGREDVQGQEPETQDPVPPTGNDGLPPEVFKGLKDEREKRQALQDELNRAREELALYQAAFQPDEPDYQEPQDQGAQILDRARFEARAVTSEMLARQKYPDFDQVKETYLALERTNPVLAQQVMTQSDPWDFAYKTAKNQQALESFNGSSIDDIRASIKAEILAELGQAPQANPVSVPKTLLDSRSTGARTGPAWAGPTSLDQILKR